MIYTSLNEIKSFNPCKSGWIAILKGQRKTEKQSDDVLFPLTQACESNSISNVCWLLGKRKKEIQVAVRFARMCADSVAHFKSIYAADAAADAANAAADAAADTTVAANAAYIAAADTTVAADAATVAAANASVAADAANAAANASVSAADAANAAYQKQKEKNKQFLIQCITEWTGE